MNARPLPVLIGLLLMAGTAFGADPAPSAKAKNTFVPHDTKVLTYKHTPQGDLEIEFFMPPDWKPSDRRPGIVFFFGGGWTHGNRSQFYVQCDYLAKRGMVAGTADYRIGSKHHTTPVECAEDAKSAIRWTRAHAAELGIDPQRLAAGGGSAGGHLAGVTGVCPDFNAADDPNASFSATPNALVLFNPVLDLRKLGEGNERVPGTEDQKRKVTAQLSPAAYVTKDAPPAIIFFGSEDRLIDTARPYAAEATKLGARAKIFVAPGQRHGFFNRDPWQTATLRMADEFLASIGYLQGPPTIEAPKPAALHPDDGAKVAAPQ